MNLSYLKCLIESLLKDISKIRTLENLDLKLKEIDNLFEDYDYYKLIDIFKDLKNI